MNLLMFSAEEIIATVLSVFRVAMFAIDKIVYKLLAMLYKIFFYVSTTKITANEAVSAILRRIGLILGIFMVFVLTFSLMQMLIDPEKIKDKKNGTEGIIKKVIISIILLGSINIIFDELYDLQEKIIESNIIGKIITGNNASLDSNEKTVGIDFASSIFFAFYRDDKAPFLYETSAGTCYDGNDKSSDGNSIFCNESQIVTKLVNSNYYFDPLKKYINLEREDKYVIEYNYIISTIAGGVACWIIFTYIFAVATRIIQLLYLQVIAPIPILTYILPKGDEKLQKWGSECLITYVDLFLRLLIINFALFLITIINEGTVLSINAFATTEIKSIIYVIIIIGILLFAKKAPNLIKELFPQPSGAAAGDFNLGWKDNPAAIVLGGLAGATTAVSGAISGGIAGARLARAQGKRGLMAGLTAAAGALKGGIGAGVRGATAGAKQEKLADIYKKQAEINASKRKYAAEGSTPIGRLGVRMARNLGLETTNEHMQYLNDRYTKEVIEPAKEVKEAHEQVISKGKEVESRASELIKKRNKIDERFTNQSTRTAVRDYHAKEEAYQRALSTGVNIDSAQSELQEAESLAKAAVISDALSEDFTVDDQDINMNVQSLRKSQPSGFSSISYAKFHQSMQDSKVIVAKETRKINNAEQDQRNNTNARTTQRSKADEEATGK